MSSVTRHLVSFKKISRLFAPRNDKLHLLSLYTLKGTSKREKRFWIPSYDGMTNTLMSYRRRPVSSHSKRVLDLSKTLSAAKMILAQNAPLLTTPVPPRIFYLVDFNIGDVAVAQMNDAVGHTGDIHVMGNDRRYCSQFAIDPFQRLERHNSCFRIKRSCRFVTKQNRWLPYPVRP